MRMDLIPVIAALAFLTAPGRGWAEDPQDDLRRQIEALRADLVRLQKDVATIEQLKELERRIDLLAAEIERSRTEGATEEAPVKGAKGLAPAASKVYGKSRGVSLGGYGEAVYENFAKEREDGSASGRTDQFDYLRQILYVGYKFSDKVLFNSEIEFEHASTGKGGEVSVEFGYVEYQPSRRFGLRAGMLLVPMGFLNELHEPPIFHGSKRPEVETAIVPSTWRENGAGLFGEASAFQWRACVVSGLSSSGFSSSGIRGGRQSGARSRSENFALTGRLDVTGIEGLLAGASFFTGKSGQGATQDGLGIGGRVTLWDVHLQYERRGLHVRLLGAKGRIEDAALINKKNALIGSKSVGTGQYGWYVEAAYDLMTLIPAGRWSILPFLRYEKLDTQDGVPEGFLEDPATHRSVLTTGVSVKPLPNVVLKADFQRHRNKARTGVDQFNLAVGYLF